MSFDAQMVNYTHQMVVHFGKHDGIFCLYDWDDGKMHQMLE